MKLEQCQAQMMKSCAHMYKYHPCKHFIYCAEMIKPCILKKIKIKQSGEHKTFIAVNARVQVVPSYKVL